MNEWTNERTNERTKQNDANKVIGMVQEASTFTKHDNSQRIHGENHLEHNWRSFKEIPMQFTILA